MFPRISFIFFQMIFEDYMILSYSNWIPGQAGNDSEKVLMVYFVTSILR